MRQSATHGHFQGRGSCMENLEVSWNLIHRRLRCLSSKGQEPTICWHTGRIMRNVKNCLAKDVSEHLVKELLDIPGWHRQSLHPLHKANWPSDSFANTWAVVSGPSPTPRQHNTQTWVTVETGDNSTEWSRACKHTIVYTLLVLVFCTSIRKRAHCVLPLYIQPCN